MLGSRGSSEGVESGWNFDFSVGRQLGRSSTRYQLMDVRNCGMIIEVFLVNLGKVVLIITNCECDIVGFCLFIIFVIDVRFCIVRCLSIFFNI